MSLRVTIQNAIKFYQSTVIKLNCRENKNDIWRCNYAISQLEYMLNIIDSDRLMKKFGEVQSCFNAMNKGIEQFDSLEINREHIRLNNEIYNKLFNHSA